MGDQYSEVMSVNISASSFPVINAAASYQVGNDYDSLVRKDRYGSFNRLIITSISTTDFLIDLDNGKKTFYLYNRGQIVIEPKDGIFFNYIKITNITAVNSSGGDVNISMARANPVN
jgi:hypothetical protein